MSLIRDTCVCVRVCCVLIKVHGALTVLDNPREDFWGFVFGGGGWLAETHVSVCAHAVFRSKSMRHSQSSMTQEWSVFGGFPVFFGGLVAYIRQIKTQ